MSFLLNLSIKMSLRIWLPNKKRLKELIHMSYVIKNINIISMNNNEIL